MNYREPFEKLKDRMNTVEIVLDQRILVERFNVDDHMHDSRDFMKYAVKQLAKSLIANGCVKVDKHYDIERGGTWTAWTVLSGRERVKLP